MLLCNIHFGVFIYQQVPVLPSFRRREALDFYFINPSLLIREALDFNSINATLLMRESLDFNSINTPS